MPSIHDVMKDYVIQSEEDIPAKYKEEVEERLKKPKKYLQADEINIIPGKKGQEVLEYSEIGEQFENSEEYYLGHGTPGGDEVIESILKIGLKVKDPETVQGYMATQRGLDSTTISFGEGTPNLYSENKELLDNWPHKASRDVVIVALPKKYILEMYRNSFADYYQAFYVGSEKEGYRLRPEFIKGVYNADTQSFTSNENYYQNLEPNEQKRILEEVKQGFIQLFAQDSRISPLNEEFPLQLEKDELDEVAIEWYKEQLDRLRKDKTFDIQQLENGLDEISDETKISDFNDTAGSIINMVQHDKEEDKGWDIDDNVW